MNLIELNRCMVQLRLSGMAAVMETLSIAVLSVLVLRVIRTHVQLDWSWF